MPEQREKLRVIQGFLFGLAKTLDGWAKQSRDGGWSTHQVEPNISAANDCRRMAGEVEEILQALAAEKPAPACPLIGDRFFS